jgi:DNA-3-methyladenine glycosylase
MPARLNEVFFSRNTIEVARDLLGKRLVRQIGTQRISGIILETEAYRGEEDLACHARSGRTPRTEIMYGPAGWIYIYFIYGMHWLLNFVTEQDGFPGAVLIRSIQPIEGKDFISRRRNGQPERHWTDGPAKVCQSLNIDGKFNGVNACAPNSLIYLESGFELKPELIQTGPRVGINAVPEPWKSIAWRFVVNYQSLKAL